MRLKTLLILGSVLSVFVFSGCITFWNEVFSDSYSTHTTEVSKNIRGEVDKYTNEKVYRHKSLKYNDFEIYYKQLGNTFTPYLKMTYKNSKTEFKFIRLEIASSTGQASITLDPNNSSAKEKYKDVTMDYIKPSDTQFNLATQRAYVVRYNGEYNGPLTIEQAFSLYEVFQGGKINCRVSGVGANYLTFNLDRKSLLEILQSFIYFIEEFVGLPN